jgi:ABC-type proline/glycine betaine transport system ATPase subunit
MNAGSLEQVGTKDELLNQPATEYVAELFDQAVRHASLLLKGGTST